MKLRILCTSECGLDYHTARILSHIIIRARRQGTDTPMISWQRIIRATGFTRTQVMDGLTVLLARGYVSELQPQAAAV